MIRIDEEVEPVIRIPIELMEYVELEEAEREHLKRLRICYQRRLYRNVCSK